jgi:hypothetical protein
MWQSSSISRAHQRSGRSFAGRGPLAEDLHALGTSVREAVLEQERGMEFLRVTEYG